MGADADALVIGAGPAGAATAILLAEAGWRVVLVEQHAFPRQKVCGECIGVGGLQWLDRLGVGPAVQRLAGAPLRRVAWMRGASTVTAALPACRAGAYRYGRALGRDRLDALLLERARAGGVRVLQPARVRAVDGGDGGYTCEVQVRSDEAGGVGKQGPRQQLRVPVVIDAHGAWEAGPAAPRGPSAPAASSRGADLLAFKASFHGVRLEPGLLPVLSLPGACGGLVLAEDGRATLACCIRRDALRDCRAQSPGLVAGAAIERWLRRHCRGVDEALGAARRAGGWLAVGPILPGVPRAAGCGSFAVGNAFAETHPLVGEGIAMALQSAALLVQRLVRHRPAALAGGVTAAVRQDYARAWHAAFHGRLRYAQAIAEVAMRPTLAAPARMLLRRWPSLLTTGSRLAGKAHPAAGMDHCPGGLR